MSHTLSTCFVVVPEAHEKILMIKIYNFGYIVYIFWFFSVRLMHQYNSWTNQWNVLHVLPQISYRGLALGMLSKSRSLSWDQWFSETE
jgi:hypothetical protein